MIKIKKTMSNLWNFVKKYKVYVIIAVVILAALGYYIFGRNSSNTELYTVDIGNVSQSIVLSGKVQTTDRADLGFASAGRLGNVFVKNNQIVKRGAVLAQLEIGSLIADLKIKQANLRASNTSLESAKAELDRITRQEDTKVESAYRKLLSSDLVLNPDSSNYATPPTISGLYNGDEGQYKVSIDKKNITLPDFTLRTFGIENTNRIINEQSATPLGTKGLYVSFSGNNFEPYIDTIWYLDIPNKTGASYIANYNAYNEAKKNRDSNIQIAQSKYQKLLTEGDNGGTTVAQAEVEKINAEIRKNTIYAPFNGEVTNIGKEVGENASVGERVVSILGENKLEVVLQVSELDVSRLASGAEVKIKLDALPGEEFTGILSTINSRDTQVDGVPVYEAFVELKSDPRIKTGMSAVGMINISSKENVLKIPNYFIKRVGGKDVVNLITSGGDTVETEVTLGLVGTDSMTEVISGLKQGDKISTISKK